MHLFYVSRDNLLLDIMQAWLELISWKGFGMRLLIQTTPRMVRYCLILRTLWETGFRCLLHELIVLSLLECLYTANSVSMGVSSSIRVQASC